jgi:choline dehydrogenase-like flavoprotein
MISPTPDRDLFTDADFIIVGSGCAGATAAWQLTAAGYRVLVVEEGKRFVPAGNDAYEAMQNWYRDGGAMTSIGPDPVPILQGKSLGGGSTINAGIQIPFPEWVWQEWVEQDRRWAERLPWNALMDATAQIDRDLQVASVPENLLGKNGGTLLRALGDKAHPIRRNTPGCKGSGQCLTGCPHDAKQSVDRNYLPRAAERGAIIYTDCKIDQIMIGRGGARGVKGRFGNGKKFIAEARKAVVLAASAIQTPWLLLRSGIKLKGNGFMCHPGAAMAGLFKEEIAGMPEATQSVESLHWCRENIKFESLGMPPAFKAARVPGAGRLLQQRLEKINHVALWGVACRAEARGRVRRGPFGPLLFYSPNETDKRRLLKGLSMMAEAMLQAGAQEVWPSVYGLPEVITDIDQARAIADASVAPGSFPMAATHLFCGVNTDDRFQAEGIRGLVVADSAFFPSNLGVNPMSAIMACAALVAQRWID